MTNVGKNIRQLRMRANLTQDALAEKLHTTRQTVSNYETGKSRPDVEMLERIAEVLNTDVNTLIYGVPVPQERKRELRALFIAAALTAALGIAAVIHRPIAKELQIHSYSLGLLYFLHAALLPAFFLLLGYTAMRCCGFWGLRPLRGRWVSAAHAGILILLGLCMILTAPEIIFWLWGDWQTLYLHVSEINMSLNLPAFWNCLLLLLNRFVYPNAALFVLPGAMLWLTRRQKKPKEPPLSVNPQ